MLNNFCGKWNKPSYAFKYFWVLQNSFLSRTFYVVFCDTLKIVSFCTIGWLFKYIVLCNNAMLTGKSFLPLVALFNHLNGKCILNKCNCKSFIATKFTLCLLEKVFYKQ